MSARAARIAAIVIGGLLVVLIIVDRVGNYLAERVAADTLQSSQHLASRPEVDIAGFPFLTQLISGHYGKVTVTAHAVQVGETPHPLVISQLKVVLHHLSVARNFDTVRADTAAATARVSYADLGRALGIALHYAGDGAVASSRTVSVAGAPVRATVTSHPQVVNDTLAFTGTTVNGGGRLGSAASATLARIFDRAISLQNVPFDVRVHSLQVGADGVTIELTGSGLTYHK